MNNYSPLTNGMAYLISWVNNNNWLRKKIFAYVAKSLLLVRFTEVYFEEIYFLTFFSL